jgi:hypothetical protein
MLYFPYLYPDEIFCSLVARYHAHTMSPSTKDTMLELFGKRHTRQSLELPCFLASFERNTYHLLKMTAEDVAWKTTMLPYYGSYLDEAVTERIINIMSKGGHPMVAAGAAQQRTPAPEALRACPQCIQEDMKRYGETYWRRSHQLRAVHFCVRHQQALLVSNYSCPSEYRLAESASADMTLSAYLPFLTAVESARLLRISRILTGFLQRGPGDSPHILAKELDESLKRSKYWTGKYVERTALATDMAAFFGPTVLSLLNYTQDQGSTYWTRSTVGFKPNGGMPIRYTLYKLFFESKGTQGVSRGTGPWLCQNPMAEHYGQPRMTVSRTVTSRKRVFECSCGLVFVEKHSEGGVDCEPKRGKTVRISESDANKIRKRYAQGASMRQITKESGLSSSFIFRVISDLPYKKRPTPKAAHIALAKMYAEKKAVEGEVLGTHSKRTIRTDEAILVEIQQAVEKLKTISPPMRITRSSVQTHLGWNLYRRLLSPEALPKTNAYLAEVLETCDQQRVRAVRWHFRNWPDDQAVFRSKLIARACIKPELHPEAILECDRLLAGLRRHLEN